jgi:hypothetical protein
MNGVNIRKILLTGTNFFWEPTIVFPTLPSLFNMAKDVSSTVVLVNSGTWNSIHLFNFAICTFLIKGVPMELVPCADGWPSTG